jgi:DNA-binding transcriptional LysR family regulator
MPPSPLLPSRLKTQQLLLMAALDEHRSVLRAAQSLHMTQPAASKLLHQLETTLGVPLFVRHARGVEPTEYGEILARHARTAIAELVHAQDEVAALRSGLAGHVAIGTEATSATTLVPRAVALLKQRFPQVSVSIDLAFSETLLQRLRSGSLDIAIARIENVQERAELNYEKLEACGPGTRSPPNTASACAISSRKPGSCRRKATSCVARSRSCSTSSTCPSRNRWWKPPRCR